MNQAFEGQTDSKSTLAEIISELASDLSNLSNSVMEIPVEFEKTYMEVTEIAVQVIRDVEFRQQEMVILQTANGHVFSVLASFLAQEAGPLMSPYDANVELVFNSGVRIPQGDVFHTNEGTHVYGNKVDSFPT